LNGAGRIARLALLRISIGFAGLASLLNIGLVNIGVVGEGGVPLLDLLLSRFSSDSVFLLYLAD